MTVEEFDVFVERLVAVGEVFDAQLSPSRQLLYFEALRDLELDQVLHAFTAAVRSCKFFPKPVEIRVLAVGDDSEHAERAWQIWKQMAAETGAYRSPTFDDAALADTLVAVFGSWEEACAFDESPEMWVAKRKEFDRVYRTMRQRGLTGPRRLVGLHERNNTEKGYLVDATGQPIFDEHGQPRRLEAGARPSEPKALPSAPQEVLIDEPS